MKINPENVLLKSARFKKNVFLISGNEETLIKKIENELVSMLSDDGFSHIEKIDNKNLKLNDEDFIFNESLFNNKKTLIYYNPKIDNIKIFNKIDLDLNSILIISTNLKSTNKIYINLSLTDQDISKTSLAIKNSVNQLSF